MIAESEAAAEDGAALVLVEEEPLPAVLDLEAAMAPGAAPSRVTAVAGGGDGGAGAHGAGGGDEARAPDSAQRRASASGCTERRRGRRAGPRRRRRLRPLPHQLDSPGLPGAAVGAGLDRARRHARRHLEHAGRVHGAPGARGHARAADGPRARAGGAAGRGVRRQADDLRAAGGGRGARSCGARCGSCSAAPRTSRPPTRRPAS